MVIPYDPQAPQVAVGMNGYYISVVPVQMAGAGTTSTSPPPNYATVQMNPNSGSTIIYRP